MNTQEVALKLVELCRKGEFAAAIEALYGKDIVSVEPMAPPGMPPEMRGIDAVRGKTKWWIENHEMHGCTVTGPFVAGDRFIVNFDLDVTHKPTKKRMQMHEAGLYTVAGGKVVHEAFFFQPQ